MEQMKLAIASNIPIVPRPPTWKRPKRENGRDKVVMFGVTSLITITFDGSLGTSLDAIISDARVNG